MRRPERLLQRGPTELGRQKIRSALPVLGGLIALALLPGSARAAMSSEYSTQAQAQRAADTRDADGDGIYCVISPR